MPRKVRISRPIAACLTISFLLPANLTAQEFDLQWRGFVQLTAEHFGGSGNTVRYDAERIRPRIAFNGERLSGAMQLDLAVDDPGDDRPGTLANAILDIYASYRLEGSHSVRFGQFKTPLGMDFNLGAHQLDITKRGMDTGLVLNRALGVMLSGEQVLGGLSYDIGVFNPPGRSGATRFLDSQVGKSSSQAARLRYDRDAWHAELAHGVAEEAGGPATLDYSATNFSLHFAGEAWTFKAEWTAGHDIRGASGRDETVHFVHAGYQLSPKLELVARHYSARSRVAATGTNLDNTYIGFTRHFDTQSRMQTRLQANYVFANGDRATYTGLLGFRENALLVQLQLYFQS